MPILRLLQDGSFGLDDIAVMVAAFEGALRELDLLDRMDPRNRDGRQENHRTS
jgi:hypothetical protein